MSRVIVVTHEASGQLIKVCASKEDFEHWLDEYAQWERHDLDTWDAAVYES